jgi:hypothetical protein
VRAYPGHSAVPKGAGLIHEKVIPPASNLALNNLEPGRPAKPYPAKPSPGECSNSIDSDRSSGLGDLAELWLTHSVLITPLLSLSFEQMRTHA